MKTCHFAKRLRRREVLNVVGATRGAEKDPVQPARGDVDDGKTITKTANSYVSNSDGENVY